MGSNSLVDRRVRKGRWGVHLLRMEVIRVLQRDQHFVVFEIESVSGRDEEVDRRMGGCLDPNQHNYRSLPDRILLHSKS